MPELAVSAFGQAASFLPNCALGLLQANPNLHLEPKCCLFPTPGHAQLSIYQQCLQKWDSSFSGTIGWTHNQTYYLRFSNAEMLEMELCMVWAKVQSLPLSFLKYLHCGEIVLILSQIYSVENLHGSGTPTQKSQTWIIWHVFHTSLAIPIKTRHNKRIWIQVIYEVKSYVCIQGYQHISFQFQK